MIRASDKVDDLLERYPELNKYLMERNIFCLQCGEVYWGALGDLIERSGNDVEKILAEINGKFAK